MNQLYELESGNVVLFVNAIRSDFLSGVNSSTIQILEQFKKHSCVYEFNLLKSRKGILQIINIITGFPGSLFVILNRITNFSSIEFLTRLSLISYINFVIKCYRVKPDVIVFNHHASFIYSIGFNKIDKIFIWHDIPSIKEYGNTKRLFRFASRISLIFEKFIVSKSSKHFAFSFSDKKFFKRFHCAELALLPIVFQIYERTIHNYDEAAWLLLGNWARLENREGAIQFFNTYISMANKFHDNGIKFVIAGNSADKFTAKILNELKKYHLNIIAIPCYENLSKLEVKGLLAPISKGAGIKVKVLESWAYGLPVIGTPQAFSGISPNIQKIGGIRVSNIEEMVNIISDHKFFDIQSLRPNDAYLKYLDAIEKYQNLGLTA